MYVATPGSCTICAYDSRSRFYNAKKVADAMEVQRKHELGEAEKQDDLGEFGTICDNTHANPLATAPRSRTRRAPTTN